MMIILNSFDEQTKAATYMHEQKGLNRYKYVSLYCVQTHGWMPFPPNDSEIYAEHENELKTQILGRNNTVSESTKEKLIEAMAS